MSDLIDRQALLKQIDIDSDGEPGYYGDTWKFIDTIKNMPNVHDLPKDADTISRQAAIDALDEIEAEVADGYGYQYAKWREYFAKMQSAQPERIRGRWIAKEKKNLFRCSKCDAVIYSESEYDRNEFHKFCGRCGADMREVER